ncbi:MAG: histidine kinase, partial [Acidaminobacteraceae bacterium]
MYFNIYFSTTNDITYEQSRELNKQIVLNFESYINSLIDTSEYIESQIEKHDVVSDNDELYLNFKLATELQKDIESIDLYYESGLLILEEIESQPRVVDSKEWFINAINNKNVNNFSKVQSTFKNINKEVVSLSKYITFFAAGKEKKGVLRIDINFNRIKELINITKLGEYGAIIFIDENDTVVYSSADEENYYEIDEIKNMVLGEFTTTINNNSMFVNINIIANTRWRMVTYLNRNSLTEVKNKYIYYFLIILLFSAFLAVGLAFRFTKKITRPIEKLTNTLLNVELVDLELSINSNDYVEIRVLNESINKMSTRIKNLMQFVIKEQEEKAELELDILQHQINPHFLYNTLDTIIVLSENDKKQEVTNTIIALSRYFRINLSGGDKYIPVEKELEQIENYLKIQKARYQERFEYEIRV